VTHVEHSLTGDLDSGFQVLREDGEYVFRRGWQKGHNGQQRSVLMVLAAAEHPSPATLDRLTHEYQLKDELDGAWAVRPLEIVRSNGRTILVFADAGGEPLDRLLGVPLPAGRFLRLAIGITAAIGKLHQRGLIHKDIKAANILVNDTTGEVRLTGFGIASRLARERQSAHSPESIAGTLAYMAPEQTGRMNRSIDSRSDLYSLGVVFYEMLTGVLPFTAADPMEWVHCHLARRPMSPAERVKEIPGALSAMVMRLLAKRAEDRYQTAAGLEHDLRRCQSEWEAQRRIDAFPLGERDIPDQLLIPEKLYGRQHEVETLLEAFDRAVKGGAPELVLVAGYSGIGKSSVVNELQPVLVPPRGLFASGKFDQYKRDVPYSTLAQAFRSLIRPLLAKTETELGNWRGELRNALEENGQLIVDLVPELKLVIGEQPPVPEVPPKDAQRRFQLVFRRFIAVFARREHPLALFLDDLQWLDAATLDLLEDLLTHSELRHLLLVGAYRDNEVDAAHPLMRKVESIKSLGGKVSEITLGPLAQEHLRRLLADALRCEPEHSAPLAQLVREKTGGNPFFTIQFIASLAEEGMLAFDHDAGCWSWDLDRIHAKGYTDNVVDLMAMKVIRLPDPTRVALQQLACLGNTAEITTLSTVLEVSPDQLEATLWDSIRQGLVEQIDGSYKFIHDRVQEATYSLIPEASRASTHLRIGRLLAEHTPPQKRDETIFDIVNHLNRGAALISSREEQERLAEFNLIAGRRAKASTAYASALKYLIAGAALLGDDGWQRRRDLIFALELERAECEFLTGGLAAADERLTALSNRTATTVERAAVAYLQMGACTELLQIDRAVAVALNYLRHVGIEFSPHPTEEEVRREYEHIWTQLGGRSIEEIADLPLMSDPESLATVGVLTKMQVPAILTDQYLDGLATCRGVNLSIERGNCDASCLSYVMLGRVAIQRFGDYKTAFRFGQVGYELVEGRGLKRFQAAAYTGLAAMIAPWMKHVRSSADLARRAHDAANRSGDLTYANYANIALAWALLFAGDPLSDVQRETELGLAFAQKTGFSGDVDIILPQLALIRTLRGLTPKFGCLDSEGIEELSFERHLAESPYLGIHACWYWTRKMQARYLSGDYAAALEASSNARRTLWLSRGYAMEAEYDFCSALCRAASSDSATADERQQHLEALAAHHGQLKIWAENCPENFENRASLVGAEIARIEGRDLDAMRLYEKAVHSSRGSGFVHNQALAYECAAAFYRSRGFEEFAHAYLRNARACYAAWGADGKVRQLDRLYPDLRRHESLPSPTSTITAPVEGLDLATVIRVSQAVSSEIVLEKLLDTVMRKAIEHAGAQRALLIVAHGEDLRVEAESSTSGSEVLVTLRDAPGRAATAELSLPESIVRYVVRTHESLILDDASSTNAYSGDPYLVRNRIGSILCLPLLNHAKLSGVLYLENNLAPRVFTPDRVAVLRVLVSQAAISLENTRLYRDLEDREAKIRRLVDSNIIGIFIWELEGRILEANDAFLTMLGFEREELTSPGLRWTDLTPPEWRERDARLALELNKSGALQPFEKEYFRKDGSRVPVLIGVANFGGDEHQGVAYVVDLSERKRAEDALRQLESELAHMNRLSMMGELSASLAHEVKQPIATARNNARAAENFLGMQPPELDGAREAVGCIVGDVDRAGQIVDRITEQIKKAPPRKERCDLNAAINEVIGLARSVIIRNGVSVQTRLADGLPTVRGDRVQLQQVMMNLILNAVEAMGSVEDGPRDLLITTEQERSGVRVVVRDTGSGIDSEHIERIFRPFYTTKRDGTGMGLSVCRSIIDAHGGRVWADSNEPRGAVFYFTLPAMEVAL